MTGVSSRTEEEERSSLRAYAAAYHVPADSAPTASTICVHRMRCTVAGSSAMELGGGGGGGGSVRDGAGGGNGLAPTLCKGGGGGRRQTVGEGAGWMGRCCRAVKLRHSRMRAIFQAT